MSDITLHQVFSILQATASDKPWMTARSIARRLGDTVDDGKHIEGLLLGHCRDCEDNGQTPTVRYSSLPSRKTLEVLWGTIDKVGSRRLENITKNDVVDASLSEFETLDKADVFLSHSHRDYDAVMDVATLMLKQDVIPWLAETHIEQGEHIHDEIIWALDASQAFVLFLSPHALDSRWTGKEYSNARSRGIPIFVVANIDWDDSTAIIEAMRASKPLTEGFLRKFEQGARMFLENLTTHKEHMAETFAYSHNPISKSIMDKLHPVRHVRELPDAIRARRARNAANKSLNRSGGSREN